MYFFILALFHFILYLLDFHIIFGIKCLRELLNLIRIYVVRHKFIHTTATPFFIL